MKKQNNEKHSSALPSARKIRRSCERELYRTIKKLKIWIPPEQIAQAEELYYRKVIVNLAYITENGSNRKLLSDWFESHVAAEIAELWNVDVSVLATAFRSSFGG